jgi:hypothetical protein
MKALWAPHRDKGLITVVSLPGVVDERLGKVYLCPNLRWLEKDDLGETLRQVFGPDVVFKHEIRLLALGHLAAEPECGDFLLVDSGSGVGAARRHRRQAVRRVHPPEWRDRPCRRAGNNRAVRLRRGRGAWKRSFPAPDCSPAPRRPESPGPGRVACRSDDRPLPRWLKQSLESTAVDVAAALNLLGAAAGGAHGDVS